MHAKTVWSVTQSAVWAWWADNCMRLSASLAFYTALSLAPLVIIVVGVVFATYLAPYDPNAQDLFSRFLPPSLAHPMGTDQFGRDQLSRVMYGGQASLAVGLGSMVISVLLGTIVGLQAGFVGGLWDAILMRLTDAVIAFPAFFLVVAITAITGPSTTNIAIVIGLTAWPVVARLIRGEVLSLSKRDFILAATTIGATNRRIAIRHLVPNLIPTLIVAATLQVAFAILTEAALSFLGLGVRPPTPSWGNMLSIARSQMLVQPWVLLAPGAAVITTVLCLNFVGDSLRQSLDPRLRGTQ